jgi:predicted small integral membrane protein
MMLRLAKVLLIAAVAFFYTLVVFNNLADYGSNYQFVQHVLLMDSTFPGNHGMWRAVHSVLEYKIAYDGIIAWETVTMILCWIGAAQLLRAFRHSAEVFHLAKRFAIGALVLSMLMWLVAFLTVGAEWFLMWQSKVWNGQEAAFRMFTVVGLVLLLLATPEHEVQP